MQVVTSLQVTLFAWQCSCSCLVLVALRVVTTGYDSGMGAETLQRSLSFAVMAVNSTFAAAADGI